MLKSLALIFLIGMFFGYIAKKLKLPSLVGMLLSGVLIGPFALNLIDTSILNISAELRQMALVVILLRAGLALNLDALKKVGRPAVLMCFVPACFEIIGMILLAPKFLGISAVEAAVMGTVIAAVSPAVVVPRMLNLIEKKYGTNNSIPHLIMAGASVDDIFVIVLFTSFVALASGGEVSMSSFASIPISIALGIIAGAFTGWGIQNIFKVFPIQNTIKVLILLSISFLLIAMEKASEGIIPFSGLLAIMTAGCAILKFQPDLAVEMSSKFSKLWTTLEILLFVLVGATVDISYAINAGSNVIILVLLVVIFRVIGVLACLFKTPLDMKERLFCMIAYTPKATVQAAIGGLPLAMGLACGNIVLTVAVLSILITAPLGALGIDLTYKKLLKRACE